ncbi:MAG TPA: hypothetical protein VHM91_21580 [Verrucomicrobiales bacterium]|nr:hypothetical protein [Verrucomicrobiales bacterium]
MNASTRLLLALLCVLLPWNSFAGTKSASKEDKSGGRTVAIRKALEGADALEVHLTGDPADKTFRVAGADKIKALTGLFTIDEALTREMNEAKPARIPGEGDASVSFQREGQTVVTLLRYQSLAVRWKDGKWEGDSFLTKASSLAWNRWFNENGFSWFLLQDYEREERGKAPERRQKGFISCFPAASKKHLDLIWKRLGEIPDPGPGDEGGGPVDRPGGDNKTALHKAARVFLSSCGNPFAAGTAICNAFGSLADPAYDGINYISGEEQCARIAFSQISPYIMPSVFEKSLSDPRTATGAARLYFGENYYQKIPPVMNDSLAPKLLRIAVQRDSFSAAGEAITRAGNLAALTVSEALREIALGKVLPEAPSRLKPQDPAKKWNVEPDLRYQAAIALARRGDAEARRITDVLAALPGQAKANQFALGICRCFLGERNTIPKETFEVDSWVLGYTAIAALEKQGDKDALHILVTGGTQPFAALVRAQAIHAIQRMTGKMWYRAAPWENEDWYGKDIREWWETAKDTWVAPEK